MIGRLAAWLLALSGRRMRRNRADWADAMLAEAAACTSELDRLGWAWGCWLASLRTAFSPAGLAYGAALSAGCALMVAVEWSRDEGGATVLVLGLVSLLLGALRPRRALLSGALVGLVVAGVIGFEAASGIHPAYETRTQDLASSVFWLILLVPAMPSAAFGAMIGGRLHRAASPA